MRIKKIIFLIAIICIGFLGYRNQIEIISKHQEVIRELELDLEQKQAIIEYLEEFIPSDKPMSIGKEYVTTYYYTNDATNSGTITGSGLSVHDFGINNRGWYTYKGYVVLAAATQPCLQAFLGGCSKYNQSVPAKHYFNYFDTVSFTKDGTLYQGIILDSCGSCMRPEKDIIDIFVSGPDYPVSGTMTVYK